MTNQPVIPTDENKKKRGRKTGYRKPQDLSNGVIDPEKIFLFVDRNTIPPNDLQRFLKICDAWIQDLGADSLSDTDIEEVALYARDRIYIDGIYRGFAEADTIDPNLINQIEKMNKGMEARKENLGARFKDRGKSRKDKSNFSFINLFEDYQENPEVFVQQAKDQTLKTQTEKNNFTKLDDYMEAFGASSIHSSNKDRKDEEEGT